jgi:hypothetical protein
MGRLNRCIPRNVPGRLLVGFFFAAVVSAPCHAMPWWGCWTRLFSLGQKALPPSTITRESSFPVVFDPYLRIQENVAAREQLKQIEFEFEVARGNRLMALGWAERDPKLKVVAELCDQALGDLRRGFGLSEERFQEVLAQKDNISRQRDFVSLWCKGSPSDFQSSVDSTHSVEGIVAAFRENLRRLEGVRAHRRDRDSALRDQLSASLMAVEELSFELTEGFRSALGRVKRIQANEDGSCREDVQSVLADGKYDSFCFSQVGHRLQSHLELEWLWSILEKESHLLLDGGGGLLSGPLAFPKEGVKRIEALLKRLPSARVEFGRHLLELFKRRGFTDVSKRQEQVETWIKEMELHFPLK